MAVGDMIYRVLASYNLFPFLIQARGGHVSTIFKVSRHIIFWRAIHVSSLRFTHCYTWTPNALCSVSLFIFCVFCFFFLNRCFCNWNLKKLEGTAEYLVVFHRHLCQAPWEQCSQTYKSGCNSLFYHCWALQIKSHRTLQNLTFLICKVSMMITAWGDSGNDWYELPWTVSSTW